VLALADMNRGLARDKVASLSIPKAYGSYDALLADPNIRRRGRSGRPASCMATTSRIGC
jgi:hypothetical protein